MDAWETELNEVLLGMKRLIDRVNDHTEQIEGIKRVITKACEGLVAACESVAALEVKVGNLERGFEL